MRPDQKFPQNWDPLQDRISDIAIWSVPGQTAYFLITQIIGLSQGTGEQTIISILQL